jgi:hypothetical protein
MKDSDFKSLNHSCNGFACFSNGKSIQKNYSPDFVLKRQDEYLIIEHETEPNRKTIVADIFKAGYFLQGINRGILIIVLTPKGKSSFESYVNHSLSYFKWLTERTNLKDVFFIHESEYIKNNIVLTINCEEFQNLSISLRDKLND